MANLTHAWTRLEAVMPEGWRMMGLVRGPREVAPVIRSPDWLAWAVGPNGEREQGVSEFPVGAVQDLANKLERIRRDPNG